VGAGVTLALVWRQLVHVAHADADDAVPREADGAATR
jgi:hypothetical protein